MAIKKVAEEDVRIQHLNKEEGGTESKGVKVKL